MKNLITLISALVFSILFYKQNIGLNLSLFTLFTVIILALRNIVAFREKASILKTIAYLITGVTVFFHKSDLTIIANIIAFFTLIGSVSEYKSSIYIQWINGFYIALFSSTSLYFKNLNSKTPKVEKTDYVYWLKIIGIPAIILIVFINLYRAGNPMFDDLISKIDFSFINSQWVIFTGLGYFLFHNIIQPSQIGLVSTDLKKGNNLDQKNLKHSSKKELINENQLGSVLMILLNLLIILFLITDIIYLSKNPDISIQVHNGVNALIFSNLLAILVILYFFRGNLNFFEKIIYLKYATFIWIFLNLILVIITAIKDIEYITSFGLTYKRIGVLFFLTLASIGLITTFLKVSKIKNLRYLFRLNTKITFIILILASTINWDQIITYYNLNNAEQTDLNYLINLSNNNTFLLKNHMDNKNIIHQNINFKYEKYILDLKRNHWQEMTYDTIFFTKNKK